MRRNLRVCRLAGKAAQAGRRNDDALLSKLPDREDRAQNEERIKQRFENAPALFFGANQESICGFFVWCIHRGC